MRIHKARHCGKDAHRCVKCELYSAKPSTKELEDLARAVEEARDATDRPDFKRVNGKRLVVQFHQCIVCNDRFAVEKHLREHLKTHATIACQFCDTAFPSIRELCRHVPTHNGGPLACRTCHQTFFSTYSLLLHMRGHTGNYQCQVCNATFMFQANLPRHMNQKHWNVDDQLVGMVGNDLVDGGLSPRKTAQGWTRELNFKCQICGELYCTAATLERHKEQVHNVFTETGKRQKFVCEFCGAIRKSMKLLKSHMTCHQVPSKKCPDCGKLFVRTCSLKSHIERIHRGRREFQCQYCGKNLTSQASLVNHERLHTGEQPYECSECGKRFRLGSSYKTHRATEHAAERPFACDKCPKQFTVRSLLTKHSRTHLPVGEWACSLCGKAFKRQDLLKSHMVLHRREVRCRQCGRQFSNDFALRYHTKKIHKIDLYRTNPPEDTNPLSNFLSAHEVDGSPRINPQDFKLFTASTHRDSLAADLGSSSSQDEVDGDPIDATCPLPTPAALVSSGLGFDPGRLSDPTNLAITAILSDLCNRA